MVEWLAAEAILSNRLKDPQTVITALGKGSHSAGECHFGFQCSSARMAMSLLLRPPITNCVMCMMNTGGSLTMEVMVPVAEMRMVSSRSAI